MKNNNLAAICAIIILVTVNSCKSGKADESNAIATDSLTIAKGEAFFNEKCASCHNFRQAAIGPSLAGITTEVTLDWLHRFIQDPKKSIDSGDQRAKKLFTEYHTIMPSFAVEPAAEIDAIIAFVNTHKNLAKAKDDDGKSLKNPLPDSIANSGLVVEIKEVARIAASSDSGHLPLTRITKFGGLSGTENPFILDLRGKLYQLQQGRPVLYFDMATVKPKFINEPGLATGFGSFAFHPDFAKNGLFYTTHTEPAATAKADYGYPDSIKVTLQWILTEWHTAQPGSVPFAGSSRELLRVNFVSGIHGVQEIAFNPLATKGSRDYGLLYIGIGDGGCTENGYAFLAHSRQRIWGTIIRIDPTGRNSANGQYGIPRDNPFVAGQPAGTLGEIYAYGFRNPHRITWTHSGKLLACNVGHGNIESLNLVLAGHDYGWPIREGNFLINPTGDLNKVYPLPADDSSYHITYPVAEYDHDEGKAISGGYEYTGPAIPALKGKYLFGDIPTGRLFYVEIADLQTGKQAVIKEWKVSLNGIIQSLHKLSGADRVDLHFGKDNKGELYILTKPDGKVYQLVNAQSAPTNVTH